MQSVFTIAKVGIEHGVLIRLVITIQIANDGKLWSIGHVQSVTLPRQTLHTIEAGRERLRLVANTIAIGIGQDIDTIRRSGRLVARILGAPALPSNAPCRRKQIAVGL